jgi:hypothetical protein
VTEAASSGVIPAQQQQGQRQCCGSVTFKKTNMTICDFKQTSKYNFFTIFVIINLGLEPDPDLIRIQQQAGSGSGAGLNKIPGSDSWFSEYRSETLLPRQEPYTM